jgi:hypothetical protein
MNGVSLVEDLGVSAYCQQSIHERFVNQSSGISKLLFFVRPPGVVTEAEEHAHCRTLDHRAYSSGLCVNNLPFRLLVYSRRRHALS